MGEGGVMGGPGPPMLPLHISKFCLYWSPCILKTFLDDILDINLDVIINAVHDFVFDIILFFDVNVMIKVEFMRL